MEGAVEQSQRPVASVCQQCSGHRSSSVNVPYILWKQIFCKYTESFSSRAMFAASSACTVVRAVVILQLRHGHA